MSVQCVPGNSYALDPASSPTRRDNATTIVDTIMYDLLTKRHTPSKSDEVCYYLEQRQKWIETVLDDGCADSAIKARRLVLDATLLEED